MGGITLTRRGVLLLAPVLALLIIISTLGPSKLPDPVSLYYTGWRTSSSSSSSSSPDTTIQNLDLVREQVQEKELPHLLSGTYRERLEASSNRFIPSQTLSFDKIFVLSLPKRIERRERMTKLAKALELKFEFILATPKESNVIDWIGERIYQIRLLKRACIAKATGMLPESIGGGGPESPWLLGDDVKVLELPSLRDQNDGGKIWTDLLREDKVEGLRSPIGFNTNQALYDPIEPNPRRQVDSAVISTYYNHMRVLQAVVKEGLGSALILEDDVDLEWDLDRLWANIHRRLPSDWDTVFLGSCWGREYEQPVYLHPGLHQSTAPSCLHGYAVSHSGALKLLASLSDPWTAYQSPIDTCIPQLIAQKRLVSFSLVPPLIIQLKDGPSDIGSGNGSAWRGVLADSTMERIWFEEGIEFNSGEPVLEGILMKDPALRGIGASGIALKRPKLPIPVPVMGNTVTPTGTGKKGGKGETGTGIKGVKGETVKEKTFNLELASLEPVGPAKFHPAPPPTPLVNSGPAAIGAGKVRVPPTVVREDPTGALMDKVIPLGRKPNKVGLGPMRIKPLGVMGGMGDRKKGGNDDGIPVM